MYPMPPASPGIGKGELFALETSEGWKLAVCVNAHEGKLGYTLVGSDKYYLWEPERDDRDVYAIKGKTRQQRAQLLAASGAAVWRNRELLCLAIDES